MSSKRIRVGLVGAGFIADFHLQILRRLPFVQIVGIADRARDRAEALARRHGVQDCFTELDEMLDTCQPDAVHVLVPPPAHAAVILRLIDRGVAVFAEKPLASTSAECQRLVERAEARGVPLGVNHNNVFHPTFQKLQHTIAAGSLGNLQHVFACLNVPLRQLSSGDFSHWMFQDPRNIVLEQGPHPFSQLRALLGELHSVQVRPSGRRQLLPGLPFYDTWQISAEMERAPATILLSFGKDFPESWIHAIGQDGAMRVDLLREHHATWRKTPWLDFYDQYLQAFRNGRGWFGQGIAGAFRYFTSTARLRDRTDVFYVGMRASITAFLQSLRREDPPPCSGRDGWKVVEFCERVSAAVDAGDEVVVEPAPRPAAAGPADVLVTGANGFLGGHVVPRLLARGLTVRALVRKPAHLLPAGLRDPRVQLVPGDITDAAAVDAAVRGVTHVYHLATGGGSTWDDVERSMVGGTREVAAACLRHGVKQLFFTSTSAACYLGDGDGPPAEEDETPPDRQPERRALYARGKIRCEQLLQELRAREQLPVTIFRPAVVVGPGGIVQHSGVGLWTRDSQCFGWGMGKTELPFVLVEDVAEALLGAHDNARAVGRTYNLVGDVRPSAREYVRRLREQSGRDFQFHPQPLWWFQAIELFKWLVKVATRRPGVEFPSYRDLKSRSLVRPLSNRRAREELGWRPVDDPQRFWDRAIGWYTAQQRPQRSAASDQTATADAAARESPVRSDSLP